MEYYLAHDELGKDKDLLLKKKPGESFKWWFWARGRWRLGPVENDPNWAWETWRERIRDHYQLKEISKAQFLLMVI